MTRFLRVAGAQINPVVGDLDGNADVVREAMRWAEEQQADVVLLPELALTGYPPEDLLLRPRFLRDSLLAVEEVAKGCRGLVPGWWIIQAGTAHTV